ncbi:hypothetical protein GUJ93_ZPchr0012g20342 [Zizania palustris]|uniref:Uncharacterized protein n=1 Tax=Zizania palustris TaxID=103762 RepID=A0A8J5WXW6_ZIZPA|nr:hypothetical protein GUJ93_ZPchr0012g20342 [Zizania palustris]
MVRSSVCSSTLARSAGDRLFPTRAQLFPLPLSLSLCAQPSPPLPLCVLASPCATIAPLPPHHRSSPAGQFLMSPATSSNHRCLLPRHLSWPLESPLYPPAPPTMASTTKSQTLARQKEEDLAKNARKFTHKNFQSVTKKLRSQFATLAKMLDYNVLGGKPNRGLSVIDSYKILKGTDVLIKEEIFLACTLGWCIEWLQAYFLVLDDIMDNSQTRCGHPCWFRVPQIRTDIEDYKCSWLVVQTLEHTDENQKHNLFENYGKSDPKRVAKMKGLYKELNLEVVFHKYERVSYNKLIADIEAQPNKAVHSVLRSFLNKIYKK